VRKIETYSLGGEKLSGKTPSPFAQKLHGHYREGAKNNRGEDSPGKTWKWEIVPGVAVAVIEKGGAVYNEG